MWKPLKMDLAEDWFRYQHKRGMKGGRDGDTIVENEWYWWNEIKILTRKYARETTIILIWCFSFCFLAVMHGVILDA